MGEAKPGTRTVLVPLSTIEALQIVGLLDLAEKDIAAYVGVSDMFWSRFNQAFWEPDKRTCDECQGKDFGDCVGCGDVPVSAGNYEWNAEPSGHVYGGGAEDA